MAFSIAQHLISAANTSDASGNTTAQIWTSTPTPGNLMVVGLTFRGNATVTGPAGWTQVTTKPNGTTAQTEIWQKVADASDTTTGPVFVISVSTLYVITQVEVAGWTGTPTLDKTGTASVTAAVSLAVPTSAATTAASEFVFGCCGNREGGTAGVTFSASNFAGGITGGVDLDTLNAAKNSEGLRSAWGTGGASGNTPQITFNLSVATNNNLSAGIATWKDVVAAPAAFLPSTSKVRALRVLASRRRVQQNPPLVQPAAPILQAWLPDAPPRRRYALQARRAKIVSPPWAAPAGGGPCAAAFVQASAIHQVGTGSGNGGTTNAVTLAGTTAGNTLIAAYVTNLTPSGSNAGSLDQSFTKLIETLFTANSSTTAAGLWIRPNIPGGSITVTLTTPSACDSVIVLLEYSGLGATPSGDGSNGTTSGGAQPNPASSGNATETQTADLILGLYGDWGFNNSVTVQDGKNQRASQVNSLVSQMVVDDLLSSTGLTNSAAFTTPGAAGPGNVVVVVAGVKCAAAAAVARPLAQPPRRRPLIYRGWRGGIVQPPWPQAVAAAPPPLPPQAVRARRWWMPDRRPRTETPWPQAVQAAPPPLPPGTPRLRRYWMPRRGTRVEIPWPQAVQAAPPPLPPQAIRARRWWLPRRRTRVEVPWPQAVAAAPPPVPPQSQRPRRYWMSVRRVQAASPPWVQAQPLPPQMQRRRATQLSLRRGRPVTGPPFIPLIPAPLLIDRGRRPDFRRFWPYWPRRARAQWMLPFQAPGITRDVDLIAYTPFWRWTTGILSSRWRTTTPTWRWATGPPEDRS